jgi:hypothetical protein
MEISGRTGRRGNTFRSDTGGGRLRTLPRTGSRLFPRSNGPRPPLRTPAPSTRPAHSTWTSRRCRARSRATRTCPWCEPPAAGQPACPNGTPVPEPASIGLMLRALPPRCVALHVPRPRRPRPPDGDPSAFDGSPPSTRTRGRLGAARNAPGRSLHFGSRPPRAQYSVVKEHPAPTTRTGPETDRPQPTPGITPAAAPFLPRPWRRKRHAEGIDGSVEEVIPPRG